MGVCECKRGGKIWLSEGDMSYISIWNTAMWLYLVIQLYRYMYMFVHFK